MHTDTASTHPLHKMRAKFDKFLADKNTRTYILVTLFALLVIVTAAIVAILLQTRQDVGVAGGQATLKLTPGSGNLTPGTSQTLSVKANIGGAAVDGFQVFIDFTGSVPTNLSFQGATIPGLSLITGSISNSTNGKTLSLLFITSSPTSPFTASGDVELGKLTFVVPTTGQMTATFNTTLTKVIENPGGANIVTAPAVTTYTFVAPGSSTTSTTTTTTTSTGSTGSGCASGVIGATATFYNNKTLSGAPVHTRCDTSLDFNWGSGSPAPGVNADNFSVKWVGSYDFPAAGTYRFTAYSDDGKRIYVDNELVMDNWVDQEGSVPVVATKSISAGRHEVRVEYYESTGQAKIQLLIEKVAGGSSSTSTTTSTAPTTTSTTPPTGLVCGLMDVDKNMFLDITDFADFAKKYNRTCTQQVEVNAAVEYDYAPGQTADLDVKLSNLGANNAVDVDLSVTNATVLGFTPTTASGWLGAIGYCNTSGALFTSSKVCVAMSKQSDIINGETVGKIKVQFGTAGTATINRTSTFAYSNGQTKVANAGNLYTLSIGNSTGGGSLNPCGRQDNNNDNQINVIDFSVLGRRYRKTNCGV